MKHDIFISYKSEDIAITKAIAHILQAENIFCWYAPRNLDNQAVGKDYDDKIVEAIKACKIVIVLLCDESLESEWVKFEVSCAQKNKKLIFPYVIRELTVDNGLLNRLTTKHWIDAYPNPEKKFNILLNNVKLSMNQMLESEKDSEDSRSFKIDYHQDFEHDFDYEEGEVLYAAKETVDAARAFLTSAENGNPKAKKMLCEIFYAMEKPLQNIPNDLWEIIDELAKQGHCYANFLMHTKYYDANDSEFISFEYLKKAIKDNSIPEAFLRLGIHYGWGLGVKQSPTLEMHYFQKSVSMGLATAYSYIGQIYKAGNGKFEKNIEQAISIFEKGVAAKDKRSMEKLHVLYYTEEGYINIEKAKSVAQKAIDCGYNEGYVWMGDIYYWTLESDKRDKRDNIEECAEAQKWYKQAASKAVKEAYSSLANMYWNAGEHDIAFRWAHNGVMHNDMGSLQALGWFYEHEDEQYDEAWKYYLKYYTDHGCGAANLARLYVDHGHRPKDYKIENLITALEVCAKNADEECIKYLINIYTANSMGVEDPQQRIMEYERLGAQLGFEEYMHRFGLRFFNKEDQQNYNPYRGMQWIEKSAQKRHRASVLKLIEISGRDGIEPDSATYEIWCDFALVNDMAPIKDKAFLNFIKTSTIYKKEYSDYLLKRLGIKYESKTKSELYHMLNTGHPNEDRRIDLREYERILDNARHKIEEEFSFGYAEGIMGDLYPDFDHKALENGSVAPDEDALRKYYLMRADEHEIRLKEQDAVLDIIYSDIKSDPSFEEASAKGIDVFKDDYWNKFLTSKEGYSIIRTYEDVCRENGLEKIEMLSFEPRKFYPVVSSGSVRALKSWCMASMLNLIRSGITPFSGISITDSDEHILDIAEKEKDLTIQCYLICFAEMMIEANGTIIDNYDLWDSYINRKPEKIVSALNLYKKRLEEAGIKHNLPEFNEEYVNELIRKHPINDIRDRMNSYTDESDEDLIGTGSKGITPSDDDEFNRLLDEFLAKHLEEAEE